MIAASAESLHYEDIEIGREYTSTGRTITVADIVNFAGVSGDFNELHMSDDRGADGQLFNQRIAHGLLGLGDC